MKKMIFALAALFAVSTAFGQTADNTNSDMRKPKPSFGEYFDGFTRQISYDRIIPAYALEVTYDKTVHVIFPAPVEYVDLGSGNIIAALAENAVNVVRVKAAVEGFETETNLAVITADGSYYSFNIRYAAMPRRMSVEMKDFMHDGEAVNRPHNALDIYLAELGSESPKLVNLISRTIHKSDRRHIKHIGSKRFGIQYLLKGIYAHNGVLYLHTSIRNDSNVPFDVDFIRIKIVDKKVAKRTAIQETVIYPLRAYNYVTQVRGKKTERTVLTIEKITIPDDKQLVIELFEKNGGRHQEFVIENSDVVRARVIDNLKMK